MAEVSDVGVIEDLDLEDPDVFVPRGWVDGGTVYQNEECWKGNMFQREIQDNSILKC